MVVDLIVIVASFAGRLYGLRSYRTNNLDGIVKEMVRSPPPRSSPMLGLILGGKRKRERRELS
jgi:hypothetical protein